jgi:hypothetical protein
MDMPRARTVATVVAMISAGSISLLTISVAPLRANDTAAALAAGGLEFAKNDQVRMVSELLRIAPRLVEVDYVFENTSSADVTTEIAFPLPDLNQGDVNNVPLNIPFVRGANFVGFQAWIDGREIKPDIEVRAFVESHEITDDLKRLGVDPVNPLLKDPRIIDALRHLNAIYQDNYSTFALWTTKVSFHWSQTFPTGKRVVVRHRYRPVYGASYVVTDGSSPRITMSDQKLGGQWCFDQSYNAAELRLLDRRYEAAAKDKSRISGTMVTYENVQYVLKTGANWQGPIGRFELQIDKGGADLVSTCPIPGLPLQRAPYGFNAVASDYTPISNLDILFVSGRSLGPADGSSGPER